MDVNRKDGEKFRTRKVESASATVIPAGSFVELDAGGLAIKATATAAKLAYCPDGKLAGETDAEVTVGNDFTVKIAGASNYAKTQRGLDYDLSVPGGVQKLNQAATTLKVLTVSSAIDGGVVGSANNIEVRIAKPIF